MLSISTMKGLWKLALIIFPFGFAAFMSYLEQISPELRQIADALMGK